MRRALLTLCCLIACKDKPAVPPPALPPPAPQDGVKLIQPGAAPYQALRYHFTKGARTASTLLCAFGIKNDGQGDDVPPLVVDLETVVDDVLGDGSAKLRFTITRAQLRDPPSGSGSEALQSEVTALQGAVITEVLAPDGKSSGTSVVPGTIGADKAQVPLASLIQSLEHVAAQLPAEPVGLGATWQQRRTLPPGGITGVAEIIYTVTALTPGSFAYTSAGQLTGGPQTIEREGVKVEISNTSGHTEGKGTVELARYALDVDVSLVFSSTMNAIAPKDTPGSGSSTVEVKMATRMTPMTPTTPSTAAPEATAAPAASEAAPARSAPAPSPSAPPSAGSAQGAHSAP